MRKIFKDYKIFDIDPKKLRSADFYRNMLEYRQKVMVEYKSAVKQDSQFRCLLCQSRECIEFLRLEDYVLFECKSCGLVSANINISDLKKKDVYNEDANIKDTIREIVATYDYRKKTYAAERVAYIKEKIFDIPAKKLNVLDVGCGPGYFIDYLRDIGIKYKGLEMAQFLIDLCRERGLYVSKNNISQEPDNSYNLVTLFDVLEHLDEPLPFFEELNRKLCKGGYVLAYTPNIHSLAFYLMEEAEFALSLPASGVLRSRLIGIFG
jgi:2-polyprenyl-3-methyl-5-hydroxy-6-metoxy-1,4-benzoquinol methylase